MSDLVSVPDGRKIRGMETSNWIALGSAIVSLLAFAFAALCKPCGSSACTRILETLKTSPRFQAVLPCRLTGARLSSPGQTHRTET